MHQPKAAGALYSCRRLNLAHRHRASGLDINAGALLNVLRPDALLSCLEFWRLALAEGLIIAVLSSRAGHPDFAHSSFSVASIRAESGGCTRFSSGRGRNAVGDVSGEFLGHKLRDIQWTDP